MPILTVTKEELLKALGHPNETNEWFENLCFEFGIELDEITSEYDMVIRE